MKDEYVIINKTAIQKRIEELKKEVEFYDKVGALSINPNKAKAEAELSLLQQFMSQSTPLIPEIDKAYWAGMQFVGEDKGSPNEYISNLKLDI